LAGFLGANSANFSRRSHIMPKWSDDIYLGGAKILMPGDPANPSPMTEGVGPLGRIYVWDTVPVSQNATNIAPAQAPAGAGWLNLAPGAGTTSRPGSDSVAQIVLDVPRAVTVAATTGGAPVVVYGLDQYGMPMAESFAAAGTGKKAFKVVTKVSVGAAGTGVSVGTSNVFGLPFRLSDLGYVISQKFGGVVDATAPLPADATTPATGVTGDVRGTLAVATAADGIKRLVVVFAMSAIQVGPNATRLGAAGVTQYAG
jgi:hypothetical protein